jgi:hypothetical protein
MQLIGPVVQRIQRSLRVDQIEIVAGNSRQRNEQVFEFDQALVNNCGGLPRLCQPLKSNEGFSHGPIQSGCLPNREVITMSEDRNIRSMLIAECK